MRRTCTCTGCVGRTLSSVVSPAQTPWLPLFCSSDPLFPRAAPLHHAARIVTSSARDAVWRQGHMTKSFRHWRFIIAVSLPIVNCFSLATKCFLPTYAGTYMRDLRDTVSLRLELTALNWKVEFSLSLYGLYYSEKLFREFCFAIFRKVCRFIYLCILSNNDTFLNRIN